MNVNINKNFLLKIFRNIKNMKAFTIYRKEEITLRQVLRKMQDYGTLNCTFEQFNQAFIDWHEKVFPRENWQSNIPYKADPKTSLLWRDDWFIDFVNYLANYEC